MNCSECLFICLSFFSNVCPGRKKQATQEPPTAQQMKEPLLSPRSASKEKTAPFTNIEKNSSEWSLVKVPPYAEECEIISIASTTEGQEFNFDEEEEDDDFESDEGYDTIMEEYSFPSISNKHPYALLFAKDFYPKIYNRKDLPAIKTAQAIILKYLECQQKPLEFAMIQNIVSSLIQDNISFVTTLFETMSSTEQEKFVLAVISAFRKNVMHSDYSEKELSLSVKNYISSCKATFNQCHFFLKSFVESARSELGEKRLPCVEKTLASIKKTIKGIGEEDEIALSPEVCTRMLNPNFLDQGKWIGFCTDSSFDKFSAFEPLDNHLKSMLIKNIVSFYLRSDVLSDIDYQASLKIFSKYNIPPMIIICLEKDFILINV